MKRLAAPNIYECWEDREATYLIGGSECTRRCDFCNIATGKPVAVDYAEPFKVAKNVKVMGLRYATVTGVARDDLEDGGAWLYAETTRPDSQDVPEHPALRCSCPTSRVFPSMFRR